MKNLTRLVLVLAAVALGRTFSVRLVGSCARRRMPVLAAASSASAVILETIACTPCRNRSLSNPRELSAKLTAAARQLRGS